MFTAHTHSLFTLSTAHHNMWTRMCYMLAMPLAPISLARRFAHMCLSRSLRQQARLNSRGGCQSPPCGFLFHVHCIPLSHTITHACTYIHTCTCTLTVRVKCVCVRIFQAKFPSGSSAVHGVAWLGLVSSRAGRRAAWWRATARPPAAQANRHLAW